MAGFREFVTGEVLTAANVDDFLMKQSVQKYADAGARDAALGTAVGGGNALREGMVAYLDSTDELLKYDGTSWATVGNAGIGSNVVQAFKGNEFSLSSTTFATITGLSATITPSSATSKILVIAFVVITGTPAAVAAQMRLRRGSTVIAAGDPAGSRTPMSFSTSAGGPHAVTVVFLDSPASAAEQTYDVQLRGNTSSTVRVNPIGTDDASEPTHASTLTLIEVAP